MARSTCIWYRRFFARLRRRIDPHVKALAKTLHTTCAASNLDMTDCWLNVMPAGTVHTAHLHPTSFISGTYYVAVPRGAGVLKFEDPRLSRQMATPPRRAGAPRRFRSFVSAKAAAGDMILFESCCATKCRRRASRASVCRSASNYGWEKKRR